MRLGPFALLGLVVTVSLVVGVGLGAVSLAPSDVWDGLTQGQGEAAAETGEGEHAQGGDKRGWEEMKIARHPR